MLNFRYGAPLVAPGAGAGLRKHGPYDQSSRGRTADVTAVVLAGEAFQRAAQTLASALEHGIGTFRGMRETFKLTSFSVDTRIVAGVDAAAYQEAATALAQSQRHPTSCSPSFAGQTGTSRWGRTLTGRRRPSSPAATSRARR